MNAALEEPGYARGWKADLRLEFSSAGSRTVLSRRRHCGPLLVQRQFHPDGDVCHCYIIHPPGGIVGGDELFLGTRVGAGAHALLTTPGATRFYRSGAGRRASLKQDLVVNGGTLEWLPQETIVFDGADMHGCTSVELDSQSRFIGWEILCLGRPESGAPFTSGRVQLDLRVSIDAHLKFLDRLRIGAPLAPLSSPWGLEGRKALGTLLGYPGDEETLAAVRTQSTPQVDLSCTLVDGILHCRAAAAQAEAVRAHFTAVWQILRQRLMNRPAVAPRIWST